MIVEKKSPIPMDIPPVSASPNGDGGLDILAGGRVVASVAIVNVEEFSGVLYFDVDIRPRSYADSTDRGDVLRSWTRLRRSGADSVLHYKSPPKDPET